MKTEDLNTWILLPIEDFCCLISLYFFQRLKKKGLVLIPILMVVVVLSETVGLLIQKHIITSFGKSGNWFNIMVPVQLVCIFLLFYANTKKIYWRITVISFCVITIFLTTLFFNVFKTNNFNTFNYIIEAILVAACCLNYFIESMNSQTIVNINRDALLYFSLGTLLFYLGALPLHSMRNYLYHHHRNIFNFYDSLVFILNCVMYCMISFGILWMRKK